MGEINRKTLGCITKVFSPSDGLLEVHFRKNFEVPLALSCLTIRLGAGSQKAVPIVETLVPSENLFAEDVAWAKITSFIKISIPEAKKGGMATISFVEDDERKEREFEIR